MGHQRMGNGQTDGNGWAINGWETDKRMATDGKRMKNG